MGLLSHWLFNGKNRRALPLKCTLSCGIRSYVAMGKYVRLLFEAPVGKAIYFQSCVGADSVASSGSSDLYLR